MFSCVQIIPLQSVHPSAPPLLTLFSPPQIPDPLMPSSALSLWPVETALLQVKLLFDTLISREDGESHAVRRASLLEKFSPAIPRALFVSWSDHPDLAALIRALKVTTTRLLNRSVLSSFDVSAAFDRQASRSGNTNSLLGCVVSFFQKSTSLVILALLTFDLVTLNDLPPPSPSDTADYADWFNGSGTRRGPSFDVSCLVEDPDEKRKCQVVLSSAISNDRLSSTLPSPSPPSQSWPSVLLSYVTASVSKMISKVVLAGADANGVEELQQLLDASRTGGGVSEHTISISTYTASHYSRSFKTTCNSDHAILRSGLFDSFHHESMVKYKVDAKQGSLLHKKAEGWATKFFSFVSAAPNSYSQLAAAAAAVAARSSRSSSSSSSSSSEDEYIYRIASRHTLCEHRCPLFCEHRLARRSL